MRQRDLRCGGCAICSADTGHNFDRDTCRTGNLCLFATAPENEGIAPLQAHDVLAGARNADQKVADRFLRKSMMRPALRNRDEFRVITRKRHDRRIDEPVVHDDPGAFDQPRGADCQQVGVARPCADKVNGSGISHRGKMRTGALSRQSECVCGKEG